MFQQRVLNDAEQTAVDVSTNLEHFILQDVLSLENEHLSVNEIFTFDSLESIAEHLMDTTVNEANTSDT